MHNKSLMCNILLYMLLLFQCFLFVTGDPPYFGESIDCWLLYTKNHISVLFQFSIFHNEKVILIFFFYKCLANALNVFIYLIELPLYVCYSTLMDVLLFMELIINIWQFKVVSCFRRLLFCCARVTWNWACVARNICLRILVLGKVSSGLRIIKAKVVWGKTWENTKLKEREAEHTFHSHCLLFSSTVGNQCFSARRRRLRVFILDIFFYLFFYSLQPFVFCLMSWWG